MTCMHQLSRTNSVGRNQVLVIVGAFMADAICYDRISFKRTVNVPQVVQLPKKTNVTML